VDKEPALAPNVIGQSLPAAKLFVEYEELQEKEVTVIGLSLDKKFLTVGGRREHRVL